MSDGHLKILGWSLASTILVGLLSVYVEGSGKCSENIIKAASLEVFFSFLVSVLQAISACYIVNRFEKNIIFAFHKVSLVASCLFVWSEVLIKNCLVEDLKSDIDPFQQVRQLQIVAVCLLGCSSISALVCGLYYSIKNKNEQVVESELLRV